MARRHREILRLQNARSVAAAIARYVVRGRTHAQGVANCYDHRYAADRVAAAVPR